jgi:hypothetical protein
MGSYMQEQRQDTLGDLLFRAASALVIVAAGTWVGLSVYPKLAMSIAIASAVAIVAITHGRLSV